MPSSPRKRKTEAGEAARDAAEYVRGGLADGFSVAGSGLHRLLVNSVKDYAIFALDPNGVILSWNEGAQRIKGYQSEEIIGRHFSVFYQPEDLAAGKPEMELRVASRTGRFEDEGWRLRKDGTLFWANVIITALRDGAGNLVGFGKVTRDLSERRAAHEQALQDTRRVATAEASSRAKTDFLAAMSHELRTPLNAIGGYVELMQIGVGGPISEQQTEYLDRVRTAQQHLLTLINDLLNYSRIEAGQVVYDMVPLPLHSVVQKVVDLIESQATRKGITLTHQGCKDGVIAMADRVKVEQILLNLLSNAIKFTPENGQVMATCTGTRGYASVRIDDSGPGIPEGQRDAIFEPFVQLGRSLTSTHDGTGLGLAISRDLARAMGGDVGTTTSALGGAAFALRLKTA